VKFILTGGGTSDYQQACPLLAGQRAKAVLADKGYDADYIVEQVSAIGAEAVIPPRSTRKNQRLYDIFLYKERNVIERMFGKMKHFRGVATYMAPPWSQGLLSMKFAVRMQTYIRHQAVTPRHYG